MSAASGSIDPVTLNSLREQTQRRRPEWFDLAKYPDVRADAARAKQKARRIAKMEKQIKRLRIRDEQLRKAGK